MDEGRMVIMAVELMSEPEFQWVFLGCKYLKMYLRCNPDVGIGPFDYMIVDRIEEESMVPFHPQNKQLLVTLLGDV